MEDMIKNQHPSSFSFENMLILAILDHLEANLDPWSPNLGEIFIQSIEIVFTLVLM